MHQPPRRHPDIGGWREQHIGLQLAFVLHQAEPRIEIRADAHDGIATIVVYDNGLGRPGTRNQEEPHGLGLKLMKMLAVKQLHGALTVATSAIGTEFTVTFPCESEGRHGRR